MTVIIITLAVVVGLCVVLAPSYTEHEACKPEQKEGE